MLPLYRKPMGTTALMYKLWVMLTWWRPSSREVVLASNWVARAANVICHHVRTTAGASLSESSAAACGKKRSKLTIACGPLVDLLGVGYGCLDHDLRKSALSISHLLNRIVRLEKAIQLLAAQGKPLATANVLLLGATSCDVSYAT